MKKAILLFTTILIGLSTYAQRSFQLGFQLSPNLGWINPDTDGTESDGLKFGFNYGLVGDFNITDNYAFSTGIMLSHYGGKINYPDKFQINPALPVLDNGRTSANIRTQMLEIPLTLKLKTNQIGYMKYYGQFGFSAGYVFEATADTEFDSGTNQNLNISQDDVDFGNEINAFRAALVVGIGAEYNLSGNTSLNLGITFNNGFTNILSEDTYAEDANGNATGERGANFKAINNAVLINVGVFF